MKRSSAIAAFIVAAVLGVSSAQAQSRLFDRIRDRADEITDAAEDLGRDVDAVTNADEVAEARIENAGTQAEREAERDARNAVESTEPVSTVRGAERDVLAAEAEANRIATTDERAAAELDARQRETERALDVEARAESEVASSNPATTARETEREVAAAEREVAAAERDAARIGQADDIAEAEARREVDPRPEIERTENALDRARRALRDID
jgi:hypothetical protein